jgi:ribonuclease HI
MNVFTDASIYLNKIGIGIFYGIEKSFRINGLVDINRAELGAIYASLCIINRDIPLKIHTDSLCCIQMIEKQIKINRKYWDLMDSINLLKKEREKVVFQKVKSHSGIYGNEVADRLARLGTYSKITIKLPDEK